MDRGYTPQQFNTLFDGRSNADRQVKQMFPTNLGPPCSVAAGVNAAAAAYKRYVLIENPVIPSQTWLAQAGRL
jgi:hypothetical protein